MESFRTTVHTRSSNHRMSLEDKVLTIGSCFSDAIGGQLARNKIATFVNPFGTVYNPHSIHKSILYAAENRAPGPESVLSFDGLFFHYDFHSRFVAPNKSQLLQTLRAQIESTHSFLKDAQWLILTYGTSWLYQLTDSQEIVANCHKQPQKLFQKSLMSQKSILASFDTMYQAVLKINPGIRIVLTVSPVRHIKDTLELNSVSKSVLRIACHSLAETFENVEYFPSYEIMLDDLRDYRFYNADMIHPSPVAEEYIWDKFVDRYFDDRLINFLRQWKEIKSAIDHRPFQPSSKAHQTFLKKTLAKLQELKSVVNVDKEIELLKSQIKSDTDKKD